MVMQQAQGSVLKGVLNQQFIQKHAKDRNEPKGGGGIPPGIRNGIAQLKTCGFAQYKQGPDTGKFYFFVSGICCEPISIATSQGVEKCQGQYVRTQIKCFGTSGSWGSKSDEQQTESILNVIRWIGGENYLDDAKTEADIEKKVAKLQDVKPYFKFYTKEMGEGANKQVYVGILPSYDLANYKPPVANAVREVTRTTTNGTPSRPSSSPSSRLNKPQSAPIAQPDEEPQQQFSEFDDISSLGERAANDDTEAQQRLSDLAERYNVVEECKAADWHQTAEIILRASSQSDDESPPDEEPPTTEQEEPEPKMPVKGVRMLWRWIGKNGRPVAKGKEVVITEVKLKEETAAVKFFDNPKETRPAIPFAELEYIE